MAKGILGMTTPCMPYSMIHLGIRTIFLFCNSRKLIMATCVYGEVLVLYLASPTITGICPLGIRAGHIGTHSPSGHYSI